MSDDPPRSRADFLTVLLVAVMFAAFSLLHVPIPGVNEPHYLCKARATWNPEWCANDFFLTSQNAHSVFFYIVGYFTQVFSLEAVAVGGRLISAVVLAWGWGAITAAFGFGRIQTLVSASLLAAIALTGNFSGEWILGGFESKVPAWGLGLTGMAAWLTGNGTLSRLYWIKTGILLGLSMAFHPVVGTWFVIAISMCEVAFWFGFIRRWMEPHAPIEEIRPSLQRLLTLNLTAFIAAIPGVIPALQIVISSDLTAWERATANRIQVFMRLAHHLDPARFPPAAWIHSGLLLCVVGFSGWKLLKTDRDPVLRRHLLLLASAIVIAAVGVAIGGHNGSVVDLPHWSWRASLLKFYPFRLVDVLLPATAAITLTTCLTPTMQRRLAIPGLAAILATAFAVAVLAISYGVRQDTPAGYSTKDYRTWKEACAWILDNTSPDSLFVTPRESAGFKWYAERAEFVCYKDCPQDGAGILEWRQRLRDLGWMRPIQLQRPLKPSDLRWMEGHMKMTHLLTRDHFVTDHSPIYENEVWRIYDVPHVNTSKDDDVK